MYRNSEGLVLSASDVVNHLTCVHLTTLDLTHLDTPLELGDVDPTLELLARKGDAWEKAFLAQLRARHRTIVEIPYTKDTPGAAAQTLAAMQAGVEIIYQATLIRPGYLGRTDFLRRIPLKTVFGDYGYEVLDTKLPTRAKASHVLQLCFYSWLLTDLQGAAPPLMTVVLGDGTEKGFRYADYSRYFDRVRERLKTAVSRHPVATYPDPCERCPQCRWVSRCEAQRIADDHLWQVAGIQRGQIVKLTDAGLSTLSALVAAPSDRHVPRLAPETYRRVREQAAIQLRGREAGVPCFDLRPAEPDRGFARLPLPSPGDLYFDMEGDPLYGEDGLEYLFGVTWREGAELRFRAFWGHDPDGEKKAFEAFVDFVGERLVLFPDLHIYHYADYERRALEELMSWHATREAEVDDWFRQRRLVDLYRVVREGVLASTDSYSIKSIEAFYRPKREGAVVSAGASIVEYERWQETKEPAILQAIERYNRDDCESTAELHAWLQRVKPSEIGWRTTGKADAPAATSRTSAADERAKAREQEREARDAVRDGLTEGLPGGSDVWGADENARYLTACLMDFHRRQDKPAWWKLFKCQEATEEELLDDPECLAGLTRVRIDSPVGRAKLPDWVYAYPEQTSKVRAGQKVVRTDTLADVTVLSVDEANRQVTLRPSAKALPDPDRLSLGPSGPINTEALQKAIARFAGAARTDPARYGAVASFLRREPPALQGRMAGKPLLGPGEAPSVRYLTPVIEALDRSHVFIQGPPGAGKTYTASHVIVELLRRGKTVGISSNSHKAIDNLLDAVYRVATKEGVDFVGLQKISEDDGAADSRTRIRRETDANVFDDCSANLVAGTAWLFARPALDQRFDYLFIDEAGQVSLGNLVAMGVAARNLVLLGDQMQLAQPIQGSHPGHSGDSALEFLLAGETVIAPERGIFLDLTYRMHPDVCAFISAAVYDGKLHSAPGREVQQLLLDAGAHPDLRATGIRFVPVDHDGNTQRSEEEAAVIVALYRSLLGQRWRNVRGEEATLTPDDILVVAPYNLQVNLLTQRLPAGARVGTVDRFQGQEAAVVLVSLATSSGDYLPRDIEFLYSKNRINVALSRALCYAVLVASPRLLDVTCRTPEEIALVNLLCWVKEYSDQLEADRGIP